MNNKCFFALILLLVCGKAFSSTSGVHGPNVDEDDRSIQLRYALSPSDNSNQEDNLAYRLHYQHAISTRWRLRGIIQYRDRGEFEYDNLRAEALYNFKKKASDGVWSSGVRFDIRTRRGERPEMFSINWTNQWDIGRDWRIRGVVKLDREFGSETAASGVLLETRSSVTTRLEGGLRIGLEMFNEFGRINNFDGSNNQVHLLGPVMGGKINNKLKWEVRILAGLTSASRNTNWGFRLNYAF